MRLDFGAFLGMLLLPSALAWGSSSSPNPKRILLSEVESLTFTSGRQTSHRRVSPIPQLRCISSSKICSLYEIDTMRCVNSGSGYDSEEIQWTCKASLPSTLKLGSTNVICEGYDYPEDKFVLKGSCGVEYRMILTDDGERQHPDLATSGWTWGGILFGIVFIGVLGWIIYSACVAGNGRSRGPDPRPHRVNRNNRWGGGGGPGGWGPGWGPGGGGGGGGGGGDFGGNDPPPPYPGNKPNNQQQQGWRPGFWSGVAGGAAAGYVAGRQNDRRQNDRRWGWGGDQDYYHGGGHQHYGSIPPRSRSNNGSNTTMHTSTGFGTTSRR